MCTFFGALSQGMNIHTKPQSTITFSKSSDPTSLLLYLPHPMREWTLSIPFIVYQKLLVQKGTCLFGFKWMYNHLTSQFCLRLWLDIMYICSGYIGCTMALLTLNCGLTRLSVLKIIVRGCVFPSKNQAILRIWSDYNGILQSRKMGCFCWSRPDITNKYVPVRLWITGCLYLKFGRLKGSLGTNRSDEWIIVKKCQ